MPEAIDLEELEEKKKEEEEEAPEEEVEEEAAIEEEKPLEKPKPRRKRVRSKRYELYETEGGTVNRLKESCPRCGPGVFMADHGDRLSCGKCGYTEFKREA